MSALCQKRTLVHLFDHLVGRDQKLRMKLQAERFGCLEVDHELKLDGLNHWEIAWLFALEDSPGIEAGLMKGLGDDSNTATDQVCR
jgi:hypothetical protein